MDTNEKVYVAAVINFFWGQGTATPESVTEQAAIVAYNALNEANICSGRMDYVPRLSYSPLSISYIVEQLVKIGIRILSKDTGIYEVCRVGVSAKYNFEISLALQGM